MSPLPTPETERVYRDAADNLFLKYDVPVPRYTSYPTVPHWKGLSDDDWNQALRSAPTQDVSVYVHVPYCPKPCTFCGCTKIVTRDRSLAKPYIETLLMEAETKIQHLFHRGLSDLHVGGGTPTWLTADESYSLFSALLRKFAPGSRPLSFSVEVDPRTLTSEHIEAYRSLGVNRISLGVQDFNEATLKAIHRIQSEEVVRHAVDKLRRAGITAINFDLVYGLPYQDAASVRRTAEKVVEIAPSRIAFYSYAHLPALKPAQRSVERHGLPQGIEKRALTHAAREIFLGAGYREIGFDHFARPDDSLTVAASSERLHRNFMGYVETRPGVLLGLGPSSLSDCGVAYAQNPKDVSAWIEGVRQNAPLTTGGHALSDEDLRRRELILDVMCRLGTVVPQDIWQEPEFFSNLETLWLDGLVDVDWFQRAINVTPSGRPYLRNIAAILDPYYLGSKAHAPTHAGS